MAGAPFLLVLQQEIALLKIKTLIAQAPVVLVRPEDRDCVESGSGELTMPLRVTCLLLLAATITAGGCSTQPPAGLASPSYSNNHTTAAGGFGLGPEQFNTNGGAAGPDMADPSR